MASSPPPSAPKPGPWLCAGSPLDAAARPLIMGVLNVTPDSLSDGGRFDSPQAAIDAGLRMAAEGADIIDIGGESTRPGAHPVPAAEELRRVLPVLEGLASRCPAPLSIDTSKPAVARRALELGARIVNDVGAAEDPAMIALLAASDCGYVLMHRQGPPPTMQAAPHYEDVAREVRDFLEDRLTCLARAGVASERVAVDPGIGFGKSWEHNRQLLLHLADIGRCGRPVLAGISRKSFVGAVTSDPPDARAAGSLAAETLALWLGAHILRTHDVPAARRAAAIVRALRNDG